MSEIEGNSEGRNFPFSEEIFDVARRVGWFLALAVSATCLHFFTDYLVKIEIGGFLILLLRILEYLLFICDFIVFALYTITRTLITSKELLRQIGIDIENLFR